MEQGLSERDAVASRQRFGDNLIAERVSSSSLTTARSAAADPMLWFLLLTSAFFGFLGQYTDAAVLLAAVAPLLGMDFYLHHRTEASIKGLSSVLAQEATVVRDGSRRRIAANEVVVGDLAVVAPGKFFPADGVIVSGSDLQVEESSLTGEAFPISKHAYSGGMAPPESAMAYAGTRLLTGTASVRVLLVGGETIYGEVVRSVVNGPHERTPLQEAVGGLVKVLLVAAVVICLLLAAIRFWQGFGWADAFLSAATLAVAAIPEEFPVVLTFFLGVGVFRLSRRKALVRRAVAVENIGRTSAICSDKTGTITEGRLAFSDAVPATRDGEDWLLTVAGLAARHDSGDPLDVAILARVPSVQANWSREAIFPFTENRRRETVAWSRPGEPTLVVAKGAPETLLGLCAMVREERDRWTETVRMLSSQAKKVIGCGWLHTNEEVTGEPDAGFRFAGLIAVTDPIRPGVHEAMAAARGAGIQVVMVTGDHLDTAAAVAAQVGLSEMIVPISGDRLEAALGDMAETDLHQLTVIARATPAQKVLVVQALQRAGRVVAVTGDGVNDAPALQAADIGIAMGSRGTRSAREVAQIILMDDNFSSVVAAIAEGRQLFQNLRMSFAFLLMIHIPLVATATIIPMLGFPLLYLPIHIVWLELLIHPAAILGFQRSADGRFEVQEPIASSFFLAREWTIILLTGLGITVAVLAVFYCSASGGEGPEHARTMGLLSLIASLAVLLLALSRGTTRAALAVASVAIVSAVVLTRIESFSALMHLHSAPTKDVIVALSAGALPALACLLMHQTPRREALSKSLKNSSPTS
nr:HAD-IC family P-type ATPase [uncultured Sphingomonas sp.]